MEELFGLNTENIIEGMDVTIFLPCPSEDVIHNLSTVNVIINNEKWALTREQELWYVDPFDSWDYPQMLMDLEAEIEIIGVM